MFLHVLLYFRFWKSAITERGIGHGTAFYLDPDRCKFDAAYSAESCSWEASSGL